MRSITRGKTPSIASLPPLVSNLCTLNVVNQYLLWRHIHPVCLSMAWIFRLTLYAYGITNLWIQFGLKCYEVIPTWTYAPFSMHAFMGRVTGSALNQSAKTPCMQWQIARFQYKSSTLLSAKMLWPVCPFVQGTKSKVQWLVRLYRLQ